MEEHPVTYSVSSLQKAPLCSTARCGEKQQETVARRQKELCQKAVLAGHRSFFLSVSHYCFSVAEMFRIISTLFFYARRLIDGTIATSTKPLSCQTSLLFVQEQISICWHLLLSPPQLTLNTAHSQPAISHSVTQYTSSKRQALSLNLPSRGGEVKCSHRIRTQASPQHWRSEVFFFFPFWFGIWTNSSQISSYLRGNTYQR